MWSPSALPGGSLWVEPNLYVSVEQWGNSLLLTTGFAVNHVRVCGVSSNRSCGCGAQAHDADDGNSAS